jgi:hypothetical protein
MNIFVTGVTDCKLHLVPERSGVLNWFTDGYGQKRFQTDRARQHCYQPYTLPEKEGATTALAIQVPVAPNQEGGNKIRQAATVQLTPRHTNRAVAQYKKHKQPVRPEPVCDSQRCTVNSYHTSAHISRVR